MIHQCRGITKQNKQCQTRVKHPSCICKRHQSIHSSLLSDIRNSKQAIKQRYDSLLIDIKEKAHERYLVRCECAHRLDITIDELIVQYEESIMSSSREAAMEKNWFEIGRADGRIELIDFNIIYESLKCKQDLPIFGSDIEEQSKSNEFTGVLSEASVKTMFKYLSNNYCMNTFKELLIDYIDSLEDKVQQGIVQETKYIDVCKRVKELPENILVNIMLRYDYEHFFERSNTLQIFGVGWGRCEAGCCHSYILLTTKYRFYKDDDEVINVIIAIG